jgi:hypothetical protein
MMMPRDRALISDSMGNAIRRQSRKHYGVNRHSLQAQFIRLAGAPVGATSFGW